jgi:hypothetical protein
MISLRETWNFGRAVGLQGRADLTPSEEKWEREVL